ncbi:MBL fold metallo-hydrolase [Flexithrix dorotheae]|uniref:MBL fold metallo-hydrolase n=1 Tax=Flexithrix dorotheae TaxID=70993 RepID=UPI0003A2637D|nr:MBL fold metallo-hydrolase [Flexithrix dorotheae]
MKQVEIQLIRNATLKLSYAGKTILVDPMLSPKNSFMSFVVPNQNLNPTKDLPFSIEKITQDIDAVLLTHSHPDHFDQKAMEVLDKDLPFYTQPADNELVKNANFTQVESISDTASFYDINIVRTSGKHGPAEILPQLGEVSGFVLKATDYPTIYIVGDCIWDDEIEANIEKFNPEIIITNSGGAIFMGKDRILMDEKETIKVAKKAPNAQIISVHIESLDHCKVTRESLKAAFNRENLEIFIPKDGESLTL